MYIYSNALKNLMRNKGRNILIAGIMLAIISATVVTLSVARTADGIIDDYRARFGSRLIIVPDAARVHEMVQQQLHGAVDADTPRQVQTPQLTAHQHLGFARSPYVMEFTMTAQHGANNPDLTAVAEDEFADTLAILSEDIIATLGFFRIFGGAWEEFATGERHLTEGRMPQADGEALISTEVAELNSLSLGDEIQLTSPFFVGEERDVHTITRTLVIVGIYFDMTEHTAFVRNPITMRSNEILTTLNTVLSPMLDDSVGIIINGTYYLRDPSYLAAFEVEARANGLEDIFNISTDEATFNAIVMPVVGLRSVAQTFMWVTLILGSIVLLILSSIAIRERKYEIGVLRAMGMKKHKLALGLWTEMLAITGICLVLGLLVGAIVTQPVSDTLLAAQVENLPEQTQNEPVLFMGRPVQSIIDYEAETPPPLDALEISLGMGTVAQIMGIALLLATLAALVSILKITKYEPIKILMERN